MSNRSGYFQVGEENVRIVFNIAPRDNATGGKSKPKSHGKVLFIIDNSGSMAGTAYAQVLSGVRYIVEETDLQPDFILYNSHARLCTASQVLSSSTSGATSFVNALWCATNDWFSTFDCSSLADPCTVVFFTDGCETVDAITNYDLLRFGESLLRCRSGARVHTMGFTPSHDLNMLNRLRRAGGTKCEGVHRYAATAAELQAHICEIFDFISATREVVIRVDGMDRAITAIALHGNDKESKETENGGAKIDMMIPRCDFVSSSRLHNALVPGCAKTALYLQSKTDVHTALCIVPPSELCGPIQLIRNAHDSASERWMPHINLVFPFVPETNMLEALKEVSDAARQISPFRVRLARLGIFSQKGGSSVAWLHPECIESAGEDRANIIGSFSAADSARASTSDCSIDGFVGSGTVREEPRYPSASSGDSIGLLHQHISDRFNALDSVGKKPFSAHLTLGQIRGKGPAAGAAAAEEEAANWLIESGFEAVEFDVECIEVVSRPMESSGRSGSSSAFSTLYKIMLGTGEVRTADGTVTISAPLVKNFFGEKSGNPCFQKTDCSEDSLTSLKVTIVRETKATETATALASALAKEEVVTLERRDPDHVFRLCEVESLVIDSLESLQRAQARLDSINTSTASRPDRNTLRDEKSRIQELFDGYHATFAKKARGELSGAALASQLQSMRHDALLSKTRRRRALDRRAQNNSKLFSNTDAQLQSMEPDMDEVNEIMTRATSGVLPVQLTCSISGDTLVDVMNESRRDVMVFALRVERPEHVIDAPTQLVVSDFLCGTYSMEALEGALQFAVAQRGAAVCGGGFISRTANNNTNNRNNNNNNNNNNNRNNIDESETGYFRGPDGRRLNAFLPLHLGKTHSERVLAQIEPLLGFFFTLDPLGFSENQYFGLFGVLGQLLAARATGLARSEWTDWLCADLTALCRAIKPRLVEYVASGRFAGGRLRTEPVSAFIGGPAGRTREVCSNLFVMIAMWHCLSEEERTKAGGQERYYAALVEETWRRAFGHFFKEKGPEMAQKALRRLLYGPGGDGDGEPLEPMADFQLPIGSNSLNEERAFEEYGKARFEELSKQKMEAVRKRPVPCVEGLVSEDSPFTSKQIVDFEACCEQLEGEMESLLALVRPFLVKIDAAVGCPGLFTHGRTLFGAHKWVMLAQALQFCANDDGARTGVYLDSALHNFCAAVLLQPAILEMQAKQKEQWIASIRSHNAMVVARRILLSASPWAVIGRVSAAMTTRGGKVFDCFVAQLQQEGGCGAKMLREKISMLMTGKMTVLGKNKYNVLADGTPWVRCPLETAKRLREVVGTETFAAIELDMHGTTIGHVYRSSNVPNRHGHCNSNPCPLFACSFTGFNWDR